MIAHDVESMLVPCSDHGFRDGRHQALDGKLFRHLSLTRTRHHCWQRGRTKESEGSEHRILNQSHMTHLKNVRGMYIIVSKHHRAHTAFLSVHKGNTSEPSK